MMGEGYCIEICVNADGSFEVSKEPMAQEMGEEQGEPKGQPAGDIKEALTIALKLYQEGDTGGDDFAEGFGKPQAEGVPPVERGMME